MGDAEGLGHGVWAFGYGDQVDGFRHQAMTPDAQLRIAGRPGEWVEAVLALMRDETTRHAIHQRALAWCEHEARAKRELP